MRENTGEHIQLIAGTRVNGYIIHLAMRLEFSKDTLLRSTALVECNDLAWAAALIGHDDLEFVSIFGGLEQIELNRRFVLATDLLADEDKAVLRGPGLGFPVGLEEAELAVQLTPSFSALDHSFEFSETLEGNRNGEFDARAMQSLSNGLVEKRTVDTCLCFDPRQRRAHAMQTVADEGIGSIGVVDITGPVVNIEDLVCLRNGTKQRVVAARTLLFLVETHRRSFGVAPGAQHRTIEVKRHSRKRLPRQAFNHQVSRFTSDFLDAYLISATERAANGRHIRQTLKAKQALDHLVIAIVVHISQPPVANDQMHDQQHQDHVMAVNRAHLQVAKTSPQPLLDAYQGEEVLKQDKTRVRSQVLRLESNLQSGPGFTSNSCFAMFHVSGLRIDCHVVLVNVLCTNQETTFYVSCALASPLAQCARSKTGTTLLLWLNLTGSELKPHAVLSGQYRFL